MDAATLLRTARVGSGLTQSDVARAAGTSQPVISAYERGHRDPTVETLRRLLAATGTRLRLDARPEQGSDLPRPVDDHERSARLVDVLLLADAFPARRTGPLRAPRMVSRTTAQPAR